MKSLRIPFLLEERKKSPSYHGTQAPKPFYNTTLMRYRKQNNKCCIVTLQNCFCI